MKIAVYSYHDFEEEYIKAANSKQHELVWISESLTYETVEMARGCDVACVFSSDTLDGKNLKALKSLGIGLIATRSAGTDHIDLEEAKRLDLKITNVPAYSPNAIAEHCIALTLALCRKLKQSFERIASYNFSLSGQVGTEIRTKTVGICGTGDIGGVLAHLFYGFGATILLYDAEQNPKLVDKSWTEYVDKQTILERCDIISLNLPLTDDTEKFIARKELEAMKETAILINTGRGELINTNDIQQALKQNKLAGFGMDVYENEKGIFLNDLSGSNEKDGLLQSLIAMDNVVVTSHQAFLTDTALGNMMKTTFTSIQAFADGEDLDMQQTI